jgi:transcriptional regulator with XRE-family HTH domain
VARQATRSLASDLRTARLDAGLSLRQVAAAAGVSVSTVQAIEQSGVEPTLQVLARVSTALGLSLSVRLYPGSGPLIRDHAQTTMISALLVTLDGRWRPAPEVIVYRPVRGVIDLVLDDVMEGLAVACEAQSELRRLEQQLRWSRAKADALGLARNGGESAGGRTRVSRLLLLRSTVQTRAVVAEYAPLLAAAYPARAMDVHAALHGHTPWPGDGILWCHVDHEKAHVLDRPPRGITVGR